MPDTAGHADHEPPGEFTPDDTIAAAEQRNETRSQIRAQERKAVAEWLRSETLPEHFAMETGGGYAVEAERELIAWRILNDLADEVERGPTPGGLWPPAQKTESGRGDAA